MTALIQMFSYHFMQRALIVGVLVSLCAALLGVSLVLKRYSMIGDGLSHVGFGALAVASALNLAPLAVAVPVADDAESYVIEAPAALKNDKNTFKHWIGPDGNTYKPGDKITVSASELYDGVTFDFIAVWEGKTISTQMTGYVNCLVPSTKDEKNSFKWDQDSEDYYKTYKSIKGKVKAVKDTETNKYTLYDNQTITIPKDTVPTKEGYVFKGWNTKRDGSGKTYQPGDAVPVTLDKDNEYVELVDLFPVFEKASSSNTANNGDTTSPGTGDDFNAIPYAAAAVVSLGAIAGVVALKKKRDLADETK